MNGPDPMAGSVVRLVVGLGPARRAVASGFLVKGRHGRFLATAFHNLSGGLSPDARFRLGALPDPSQVEVWHGDVPVGRFATYAGGRSLFRVHPDPILRCRCDVAAVDYALLEANASGPLPAAFLAAGGVNEHPSGPVYGYVDDMFLPAGRDALVLGFPGGRDAAGQPIAACCKIAAPPRADLPTILVSGPTHAGCSGAPVIARDYGGYFAVGAACPSRALVEVPVVDQWLGLYSGRLHSLFHQERMTARTTQVGVVWTSEVILQVGDLGVPDWLG